MCKPIALAALIVFASGFGFDSVAAAAETGRAEPRTVLQQLGGDIFAAGAALTLNQPVAGDLIVGAGTVDVDAPVAGDLIAFGGKLRVGADVGQSVYAAGGQVTVNGQVGRSVRVAGGQFELGPKSEVAGNVSAAGGQARLYGSVKGHVQSTGGRLLIDGPVGGDVLAATARVELGPNARIAGKLRYGGSEPPVQDAAAQVAGGIERLPVPPGRGDGREEGREASRGLTGFEEAPSAAGLFAGVWTLGLILLAGLLLLAWPDFCAAAARTLRERLGASLLLGFVVLVCTPVAAALLFITLVGIPVALLAMALYAALLPLGYVLSAIGLGQWALVRWFPERAGRMPLRFAAAAAALLALALLAAIPVIGALAGLLALLAGLGALLMQFRRTMPRAAA